MFNFKILACSCWFLQSYPTTTVRLLLYRYQTIFSNFGLFQSVPMEVFFFFFFFFLPQFIHEQLVRPGCKSKQNQYPAINGMDKPGSRQMCFNEITLTLKIKSKKNLIGSIYTSLALALAHRIFFTASPKCVFLSFFMLLVVVPNCLATVCIKKNEKINSPNFCLTLLQV